MTEREAELLLAIYTAHEAIRPYEAQLKTELTLIRRPLLPVIGTLTAEEVEWLHLNSVAPTLAQGFERDTDYEQKARREPLLRALEKLLEDFAEVGMDLRDLPCHRGLVPVDRCGRCSKVIKARDLLGRVRGFVRMLDTLEGL